MRSGQHPQRPARPVEREFMRQWIGLHQGDGRPSLLVGKMVHPPRVETGPYIPASHRQGAPGSRAATPSGATEPAHGTDVLAE